ncbi:MAG: tetratricopeptide repeat protein, partial [Umezawaea sp.]
DAAGLRRLAELCDGLPLALRIAAARLAVSPTLRVADFVAELDDEHGRLAALGLEDGEGPVRAALDASRRALPPLAARLLALLGLHPGPHVTPFVAAALVRVDAAQAQRALDSLAAANLLSVGEPGRYGAHDLVRVYTKTLAGELAPEERRDATGRMLDYYLHVADIADGLLPISRGSVRVEPKHPPTAVPKLASSADAIGWLEAEEANLLAVADLAADSSVPVFDRDWLVHAWQLAYALSRFFWLRADHGTWLRITESGLRAATELGESNAKFVMLFNLGTALLRLRRVDEALVRHSEALDVARASGDVDQQARALVTLADTLQDVGRTEDSEAHYREAIEVSRTAGSRWTEANAHHNLGLLYLASGRNAEAPTWLRAALGMYREVGEQCGESICHSDLSGALLAEGRFDEAAASARSALTLATDAASPYHQALAHDRLATVFDRQGVAGAVSHWQRALALYTELDAPEADQVRARLARTRAVSPTAV